tara:strand:+ start:2573 stop:3442 length:870 start_codon:yes stop_codon:yes gene_type:complete
MNAQLVKNKLSEYYYKSLFVDSLVDIHPVSLINSVKSIIGIDFNISHDLLLNYCINYSNSFQSVDSIGVFEEMEVPAAVSFATLEESLINRDFDKSLKNVYSLLKVSDGKHILEFLLEFTLKYNNSVYSLVWSVYKMSLFLNHKNINDSIIFCLKYISDDEIGTKISENNELKIDFSKYVYSSKSIKKILIYYSILDEDLVRIANISKYIKINTFRKFNFSHYNKELVVYDDQIKYGRKWISLYLENLKEDQLDVKLIITLDMFRGALKVSNGQYDKEIWNNLNIYLDK